VVNQFQADALGAELRRLAICPSAWWVAYSGGLDSHCLLAAMAALRNTLAAPVVAVHVNHGLQPQSVDWGRHCAQVCEDLEIPLHTLGISVSVAGGDGVESAARAARYAAWERMLPENACLLTAHHQDDQAETLLLRLLRGAGPRGLASMLPVRRFGRGNIARPLLSFTRDALVQYAKGRRLQWIEDPSNEAQAFDRNFLRHSVIPLLKQRWPAAPGVIARAAAHAAEARGLLDEVASSDLGEASAHNPLSLDCLSRLAPARRRNLFFFWLQENAVPPPSTVQVDKGLPMLLEARGDGSACLHWGKTDVRRFRRALYLVPAVLPNPPRQPIPWDLSSPLRIPGIGDLIAKPDPADGALSRAACLRGRLTVTFRTGGERCRPTGSAGRRELKKVLQELAIPPWERSLIPLVRVDDELAAVGELLVCHGFQSRGAGDGVRLELVREY